MYLEEGEERGVKGAEEGRTAGAEGGSAEDGEDDGDAFPVIHRILGCLTLALPLSGIRRTLTLGFS